MAVKLSEEQKLLRNRYEEILKGCWSSQRMIDFDMKQIGLIVPLDHDDIYVIEKPSIETSFCFGYGMYLRSNDDDEKRAFEMEHHARTDPSYFINANLEPLNRWIEDLQSNKWGWGKRIKYNGQTNPHLVSIEAFNSWEERPDLTVLTENEIQNLVAGYEEVKAQFIKRLNTYLKRYGLSKLNTWTYLRD
ncbi:hypothetical protein [Butyrivibrio sp. INlla21]|uniref:hypothetical protein n=1 Tax=Butyrivibrio sp. INlla21 TaxID=1520811 RepID=UPI0008E4E1E1|nr:hypothetical protein [Butyrivibrio sp. INlla21]SFU37151.1 hypothetical protein SAMN02910342_00293 [Butyrivibrio sp. INlla21]